MFHQKIDLVLKRVHAWVTGQISWTNKQYRQDYLFGILPNVKRGVSGLLRRFVHNFNLH
jgi:hypothetical protein